MKVVIRPKKMSDCRRCEEIVTLVWNQTYKGIVSDEFLKYLEYNEKRRAEDAIKDFRNNKDMVVVIEVEGLVVGFIKFGEAQEENSKGLGEIKNLYILKDYQKKGFGKKLLYNAARLCRTCGMQYMIVGCLKENENANGFYQHTGGKLIGSRYYTQTNQNLPENIYAYNLQELIDEYSTNK